MHTYQAYVFTLSNVKYTFTHKDLIFLYSTKKEDSVDSKIDGRNDASGWRGGRTDGRNRLTPQWLA